MQLTNTFYYSVKTSEEFFAENQTILSRIEITKILILWKARINGHQAWNNEPK